MYTYWFDAECEQATRKNLAYKGMQQRNHTRKAVKYTELPEMKKREYINGRRRHLLNMSLRNWNASGVTMKANPSIKN
jgi:hypothetical protein